MRPTLWIKRRTFRPPKHLIGADLFWWRESPSLHTLATIYTPTITGADFRTLELTFVIFDASGAPCTTWRRDVRPDETILIDSALVRQADRKGNLPEEGTLAAFLSSKVPLGPRGPGFFYCRLYSLVDWYSEEGELVSLHNDQSILAGGAPIEFTEIAFLETEVERNYLVILNGNESQMPGSISLTIRNHRGETRSGTYEPPMKPFSLHKLHLAELFPGLADFCDGQHACLWGDFNCRGLFLRPYVMTQGSHVSGYHGGDRYDWNGLSRDEYERLGCGETNPMAVVENDEVRTTVNLFNTHGHIEEDFWVDARLYDETGQLVADRPRWLCARRHHLARGDISDLLPDRELPFVGHVSLSFSPDDKPEYPGRLQALLEYRTAHNTARVMAWSDKWNSSKRQASAEAILRAYYRVLYTPSIVSALSITNCGPSPEYDREVAYTLRLQNTEGDVLTHEGTLAPHATDFATIDTFFPEIESFLGGAPAAMAVVESTADLAIVTFARHRLSGVHSAEHFMALVTEHNGKQLMPCGS